MFISPAGVLPAAHPAMAQAQPPENPPPAAQAAGQEAAAPAGTPPAVIPPEQTASSPGDQYANQDQDRARRETDAWQAFALDAEEKAMLNQLKQRDRQVRAHEAAHVAAGGQYISGGASFTYQKGPDGRQYAVGGEVPIDASKVAGDPQATLDKARTVRRAALAPANPSSADRSVAAKASQMENDARTEMAQQAARAAQQAAPMARLDKVV